MRCAECAVDIPRTAGFCPSCGATAPTTRGGGRTTPVAKSAAGDAATTQLLDLPDTRPAGPRQPVVAPQVDAVRRAAAQRWADFGRLPAELRLSLVGACVTLVSFFLLTYAAGYDAAVQTGGRLWWRPIAAVGATVLVFLAVRHTRSAGSAARVDQLLAAVTIATLGVTEAGLIALLSGSERRPGVGFYGMLAGLLLVLAGALLAGRRRLVARG